MTPTGQVIQHPSVEPELDPWAPLVIAFGASGLVFLVSLGLMYWVGLLNVPNTDTGEKALAAALGLAAATVTAAVTMVGLVLKYSLDFRTSKLAWTEANRTFALNMDSAERAKYESERNYALSQEAEKRNSIDAAIRAVALLAQDGKGTTSIQCGGVLLALASLGEIDLAIALLAELWPQDMVPWHVADVVVTKAFLSSSAQTMDSAATVLFQNGEKLTNGEAYMWATAGLQWDAKWSTNSRLTLVKAAAISCAKDLESKPRVLPALSAVLYRALEDPDDAVRGISARCLTPISQELQPNLGLTIGDFRMTVADMSAKLSRCEPSLWTADFAVEYEKRIADAIGRATQ